MTIEIQPTDSGISEVTARHIWDLGLVTFMAKTFGVKGGINTWHDMIEFNKNLAASAEIMPPKR